ncbi:putative phage abortive infection protein [Bacillus halotolerans]|uniref:putative phage abortive infection protein n=1 Tax=Bacillus halotolerans TaxID=260554 RepID=UPI002406C1A8|nr:putative phage abortive infection protein [Bacillus halotolerans]MDG0768210.1 putative phage abortive infection protein [Bacillus halotolerans]
MSENDKKDKWYGNENIWMWAGLTACGLALIIPFVILIFTNEFSLDGIKSLGAFGDFFGGTTVGLFNLSSILLVLVAVIIQRKELKETRSQFQKQQIDNTFFNMINLHNQIVSELEISGNKGKYALNHLNKEVKSRYKTVLSEDKKEKILQSYEYLYKNYYFGHYFRNMYRIMKFIDRTKELSEDEKRNYIGILRAQLSTGELLLIFYNALSERGEKFKKLILDYDFFDDLLNDDAFYNALKHYLK